MVDLFPKEVDFGRILLTFHIPKINLLFDFQLVKQAIEAGVSAEGSTLDILERINHKNVVKQAKEAGVSAEGSTLDILERINHANVIKQAKRMGVSTEGSTMEILERITRKQLEESM